MYENQCGLQEAMRSLPYGAFRTTEVAHKLGIVEEVCQPEELTEKVDKFVKQGLKIESKYCKYRLEMQDAVLPYKLLISCKRKRFNGTMVV